MTDTGKIKPGGTMRDEDEDGPIMIRMDIDEPLDSLKAILEETLPGINDHLFTLQDGPELDGSKSLVEHGVQGEGDVVIHLELREDERGKRLDIVDVLKPADDELTADEPNVQTQNDEVMDLEATVSETASERGKKRPSSNIFNTQHSINGTTVQLKLKRPRQRKKKPVASKNDIFIMEQPRNNTPKTIPTTAPVKMEQTINNTPKTIPTTAPVKMEQTINNTPKTIPTTAPVKMEQTIHNTPTTQSIPYPLKMEQPISNTPKTQTQEPAPTKLSPPDDRTSGGSKIQLWQFLLELLTDHVHINSIQWNGKDGEFEIIDPERVAQLWGIRKNKPQMNYEKLSRALRYYYDGDMIAKVPGLKFVFKFICDLKFMIGYSAGELNAFVHEAAAAAKNGGLSERTQPDLLPILISSDYNTGAGSDVDIEYN